MQQTITRVYRSINISPSIDSDEEEFSQDNYDVTEQDGALDKKTGEKLVELLIPESEPLFL